MLENRIVLKNVLYHSMMSASRCMYITVAAIEGVLCRVIVRTPSPALLLAIGSLSYHSALFTLQLWLQVYLT